MASDEPFQSSYRRHRPQRFGEVRGQDHITTALRNAVRNNRVGHAYLFSGPRGTGKTSTARILAAALNCEHPVDGEPDCICASCVAIRVGTSLDVLELDAASNNGVDAMRDLVTRAALGSPGRSKVYIVDEVHMLTTGASNALLKTLEEPPAHVVFVLATTDAQKVLPTIKSRTQHYHFRLLAPEVLTSLLADVNDQDDLGLDPSTLDLVVRRGNGSARDALSALDQAAAAGGSDDEDDAVSRMVEALIAHDAGAALVAVAEASRRGRDPHRVALELVEHLRSGFLLVMAPDVSGVPTDQRAAMEDQARRLGTAATVRAMEVLGETLVDMREALDTRVTLELALVRLCAAAADTSPAAILERLELLEKRVASAKPAAGSPPPPAVATPQSPPRPAPTAATPSPAPAVPTTAVAPSSAIDTPPSPPPLPGGRPTIGAMRRRAEAEPPRSGSSPSPEAVTGGAIIDRDELTKVWGDRLFAGLSPRARAVYRMGRWTSVDGSTAVFALPAETYRGPAEDKRSEIEGVLATHFGGRVNVRFEIEGVPETAVAEATVELVDEEVGAAEFAQLAAAPDAPASAAARLLEAFPGTEEVQG